MSSVRTVVWFSCGAASAVAAMLTLRDTPDAVLVYADTGSEHEDNVRFLADVERWLGVTVTVIRSEKYRDTWQVFKERRYLVGPKGALCTAELKKIPRFGFQRPDDIQVFGYTADAKDRRRADRFREQNFDVDLRTPLIEKGLTKSDTLAIIERAGIKLPAMYLLGYTNNNCIGCVKGGAGYWNKIRVDFPEVFQRMSEQEQELGATVLRKDGKPLPLAELKPGTGRYEAEEIGCSLLCADVLEGA